jgi:hypothetical protein
MKALTIDEAKPMDQRRRQWMAQRQLRNYPPPCRLDLDRVEMLDKQATISGTATSA